MTILYNSLLLFVWQLTVNQLWLNPYGMVLNPSIKPLLIANLIYREIHKIVHQTHTDTMQVPPRWRKYSTHTCAVQDSSWSRRRASSSPTRRAAGWTARHRAVRSRPSTGCRPMALPSVTWAAYAVCCATERWCCCRSRRPPIGRTYTTRSTGVWPPTRSVA